METAERLGAAEAETETEIEREAESVGQSSLFWSFGCVGLVVYIVNTRLAF